MLSFIRRITQSKVGVFITMGVLAVIALAFALGDITGNAPSGAPSGANVAKVGDAQISDAELQQRVRVALDAERERRQGPVDINAFVDAGGVEGVLDQIVNTIALDRFAQASGMVASKALVDGQIASIPAFQGFDGKFNQATFERLLQQRGITQAQLREDIRRETFARWLITPTIGASQVADRMALPYASLLLEKRQADIAFVPARPEAGGAAPTDEQLATFYQRNRSRYLVPERRVLRYALVSRDSVANGVTVSDAELQAAYRAAASRYGATETRSVSQVIVADQALAGRLAQQVRGGATIEAAARGAGLEPSTVADVTREALAGRTSAAVAEAAFGAPANGVVGPVRSGLGFHVLRVTNVAQRAGRTLEQARGELTEELRTRKIAEALNAAQDRIDRGITEGGTFDEIAADARLQGQRTPPVTAQGFDPDNPERAPDPALERLYAAGFDAEEGDAPQLVALGEDGSFALVALERIVPAAPRPLATIRETVARDYGMDRARQAARAQANAIVKRVEGGAALRPAIAAEGVQAPPVQSIDVARADLARRGQELPPPVTLMFSMKQGSAKILEAPDRTGWFIVTVTGIQSGNAQGNADAINATRAGLASVVGNEYAEQFAAAARGSLGVTRNEQAVQRVRNTLTGRAE
jgi:peptidyl-prolyl cis-trans isomerase D